jgi:polyisoprenoid-binding protein YceI
MTRDGETQLPAQLGPTGRGVVVPTGLWHLDPMHSSISFSGRYLGVVTMKGAFERFSGSIIATDPPEHSSVSMSIEAATITTGVAHYDDQLRSADFLDTDRFPEITFRSTRLIPARAGWDLRGEVTICGICEPVTTWVHVDGIATDPVSADLRAGVRASVRVDRERFGLMWNHRLPGGGLLLSKHIDLDLALCAVLSPPP